MSSEKKRANRLTWKKRLLYDFARVVVNLFFRILYQARYYGCNNMPQSGGVIVISNHQSHFDPPLVAGGLRRQLNFLARKSLFTFKPFAKLIDAYDAIPLDKDGIGFEGIKESFKRLRNGEAILICPEGERTWNGNIVPFVENSLVLAQRSRSAILPAAIAGCFQAFPRTHTFPYFFGKIRVVYGEALLYDEIKDLSEPELRFLCERRIADLYATASGKT
ncbi:hypothetical protein FACS189443_7070 [Planctomycetales bacterium]|nr:hypothetical protein FACS189443_7070 [Planctomycetales bacterium]